MKPPLTRTPNDPFLQQVAMPHQAVFNVMGVPVLFESNDLALIQLAAQAYKQLPATGFQPPHLCMRLLANDDLRADAFDQPPPYLQYAHADLFSALFSPADAVLCSLRPGTGLVTVSPAMRRFAHTVRYEMIENAAFNLLTAHLNAVPLHAACLIKNNTSLLIFGDTGAGKSTLALACLLQGWQLIAEDSVFMLPGHPSELRGVPNFLHITQETAAFFPEAALQGERITRRSGKTKLALDVRTQFHAIDRIAAPLGALVFLVPMQTGQLTLLPLAVAAARELLLQQQPFATGHTRWPQALEKLLACPIFQLTRGDARASANLLEALL